MIEGVAAPESANNAASTGALVPLMALGIPGSGTTAVMLGALTLYGMQPGPLLMSTHPEVFWGLVASMYIGNVMLLILNLPLAPVFASVLRVPYSILIPIIIGIALLSGLAFKFSALVMSYTMGYQWAALLLVLFATFVLGMGITVTADYLILALLAVPGMHEIGIPLLAAHFCVFWYSQSSNVTPPVCMAAFASKWSSTSWRRSGTASTW